MNDLVFSGSSPLRRSSSLDQTGRVPWDPLGLSHLKLDITGEWSHSRKLGTHISPNQTTPTRRCPPLHCETLPSFPTTKVRVKFIQCPLSLRVAIPDNQRIKWLCLAMVQHWTLPKSGRFTILPSKSRYSCWYSQDHHWGTMGYMTGIKRDARCVMVEKPVHVNSKTRHIHHSSQVGFPGFSHIFPENWP